MRRHELIVWITIGSITADALQVHHRQGKVLGAELMAAKGVDVSRIQLWLWRNLLALLLLLLSVQLIPLLPSRKGPENVIPGNGVWRFDLAVNCGGVNDASI